MEFGDVDAARAVEGDNTIGHPEPSLDGHRSYREAEFSAGRVPRQDDALRREAQVALAVIHKPKVGLPTVLERVGEPVGGRFAILRAADYRSIDLVG